MLAVIADDITGAAEIAGIGYDYGLKVVLTRQLEDHLPACDLLVCITNTRSLPKEEAISQSLALGKKLTALGIDTLFKKTDSVLRGHVLAELEALLEATDKQGALLPPANPSLGRQLIGGIYYVNQQPIIQTPFYHDPAYPARRNDVLELLGGGTLIDPQGPLPITAHPITVGNVSAEVELADYSKQLPSHWLPAGGSSFFKAFLTHKLGVDNRSKEPQRLTADRLLLICGSTIHHNALLEELQTWHVPVAPMPTEVFHGNHSPHDWFNALNHLYEQQHRLVVTINQPVSKDPAYAQRLKHIMAEVCSHIIYLQDVKELAIEGGATAYEVIETLGWHEFEVIGQLAPGIIRLQPLAQLGLYLTLKPGSYHWPVDVLT